MSKKVRKYYFIGSFNKSVLEVLRIYSKSDDMTMQVIFFISFNLIWDRLTNKQTGPGNKTELVRAEKKITVLNGYMVRVFVQQKLTT